MKTITLGPDFGHMGNTREDFPLQDYYKDIYQTYDRVNRVFTFGRDRAWRKKAAAECLAFGPEKVLDLCTGTGDFVLELAAMSDKNVAFTGYDFTPAMLDLAREKYQGLSLSSQLAPVKFMEGEVAHMPFADGAFDALGITFGIRNLVYENSLASRHLSEMNRVLRPGGLLVLLESSRPDNFLWRTLNTLYLQLILPYLGGIISGNLKAYRYLARSSKNYYSIREMGSILEQAGFKLRKGEPLFLGSVMLVIAEKK
jgi:demethylmenaquinone methyltransferase/2-methoxy-6-polyprenyl-1,4-benzoquinol methylase